MPEEFFLYNQQALNEKEIDSKKLHEIQKVEASFSVVKQHHCAQPSKAFLPLAFIQKKEDKNCISFTLMDIHRVLDKSKTAFNLKTLSGLKIFPLLPLGCCILYFFKLNIQGFFG